MRASSAVPPGVQAHQHVRRGVGADDFLDGRRQQVLDAGALDPVVGEADVARMDAEAQAAAEGRRGGGAAPRPRRRESRSRVRW
jgi:hypothetical protein